MKALIEQLRNLNEIDVRLQTFSRDLERLPQEVAAREEELRVLSEDLDRRKAEVQRLRMDADTLDVDLKAGMDALRRLSNQMNVLRTSKEFDVVRRQMDAQRGWNSQLEDKILALMTQADDKQKEMDQVAAQLAEKEKELAATRQRVEEDVAELREQQAELLATRQNVAKDVPDKELATYDRIVVNRGQAIAKVKAGGYCTACHMKLPPQIHNLALLAQDLVTCPSCGRILSGE